MSESSNALSGFAGIDAMSVGELAVLPAATLASLKAQVEQIYEEARLGVTEPPDLGAVLARINGAAAATSPLAKGPGATW